MVTIRVRSLVWFVTGALLATSVTLMFVNAWRVDAAPGDSDTTFVPIAPGCRFADTRQAGQGGPIGPGQVRPFTAHGTHNACTIPTDAVALLMNLTVDNQTAANSFLTIWGNGGNPGTSALNPAAGEPPTPNAVTTDLTPTGVFNIRNNAGFVNLIIDINGYYTKTSLTALERAQPFAVTDRDDDEDLGSLAEIVVSVTLTAPVAGQVTVNSTTIAIEGSAGDVVRCSIRKTGLSIIALDFDYLQRWESAGTNGAIAQLAGTRMFDIAAGAIRTFSLVCDHAGSSPDANVQDSVLTAIFTPAP
jgi:hypothetical protein